MKAPSLPVLIGICFGLLILALISVGAPISRKRPHVVAERSEPPPPSSVTGGGLKLTSTSIELPFDDADFPEGPHADIVRANCTACHSASMVLTQPVLSAEQWKATITKMREAYHAPVSERDVPAIIAYLIAVPSRNGDAESQIAQVPAATPSK